MPSPPQDQRELFHRIVDYTVDQAAYEGPDDAFIDFRQLYGVFDSRQGKQLVRQLEQSTQLQAEILAAAERANRALHRAVNNSVADIVRRYGPR